MMSQNYHEVKLINQNHQFQFDIEGSVAFIDYGKSGNDLVLIHTEVPKEIEGKGVAAALVERTFEYAEKHGLKIIPRCTYVIAFLKRHPEWNRIVDAK